MIDGCRQLRSEQASKEGDRAFRVIKLGTKANLGSQEMKRGLRGRATTR